MLEAGGNLGVLDPDATSAVRREQAYEAGGERCACGRRLLPLGPGALLGGADGAVLWHVHGGRATFVEGPETTDVEATTLGLAVAVHLRIGRGLWGGALAPGLSGKLLDGGRRCRLVALEVTEHGAERDRGCR